MQLLKSRKFLRNARTVLIVVDFKDSSIVDFNKEPIDHSSYEKAKAHNEHQKDSLDDILKKNF